MSKDLKEMGEPGMQTSRKKETQTEEAINAKALRWKQESQSVCRGAWKGRMVGEDIKEIMTGQIT